MIFHKSAGSAFMRLALAYLKIVFVFTKSYSPVGQRNRKRWNIWTDKGKERAHRSRKEHQDQTGSRENGQGGRKPDSKNSAPYGESFPGFFPKGENPGTLTNPKVV